LNCNSLLGHRWVWDLWHKFGRFARK
jgi:hypothetical protein